MTRAASADVPRALLDLFRDSWLPQSRDRREPGAGTGSSLAVQGTLYSAGPEIGASWRRPARASWHLVGRCPAGIGPAAGLVAGPAAPLAGRGLSRRVAMRIEAS